MAALLWPVGGGGTPLRVMVAFLALAGITAPLLYAATFRREDAE